MYLLLIIFSPILINVFITIKPIAPKNNTSTKKTTNKAKQNPSSKKTSIKKKFEEDLKEIADLPEDLANSISKSISGGKMTTDDEAILTFAISLFIRSGLKNPDSPMFQNLSQLKKTLLDTSIPPNVQKAALDIAAKEIKSTFLKLIGHSDDPNNPNKQIDNQKLEDYLKKNGSADDIKKFFSFVKLEEAIKQNNAKSPENRLDEKIIFEKYRKGEFMP